MSLQSVRGFKDWLPPEAGRAARLERRAREVLRLYGYEEIRLPSVEPRELFVKSTGETSDIVEKEMFELEDAAGRKLALRPEGTPGVVRAYLQHHLRQQGGSAKLFYIGGMFRAERPQAGRFREFVQVGAEALGNPHPAAEAELLDALCQLLDEAGLKGGYRVNVNNLGCEAPACRPAFRGRLKGFLESARAELCANCLRRIERNPLRALDCKADGPKLRARAPALEPCGDCLAHFETFLGFLRKRPGPELPWELDPGLVRGLDYYDRTVFELKSAALGSQDALAGGGRYDGLVEAMGGPATPAAGWALGLERVLSALEASGRPPAAAPPPAAFVAVQGDSAELQAAALNLLRELRAGGVAAEGGLFAQSLKAQMREAGRLQARFALILGEREFAERGCVLKDMRLKDSQRTLDLERAAAGLREALTSEDK